jgi:hypothetical protein
VTSIVTVSEGDSSAAIRLIKRHQPAKQVTVILFPGTAPKFIAVWKLMRLASRLLQLSH